MCADHERATSSGSRIRNDVLRRRPNCPSDELQLDDRVRRGGELASDGAGDRGDRDRRCPWASEGAVEPPSLGIEDEDCTGSRGGGVPRLHGEEARASTDECDRPANPLEVVPRAAVLARYHRCPKTAPRGRRRVFERLDRELPPGRSDLRSPLDALPVRDERKALGPRVVARAVQLAPHVPNRVAIAGGAGSPRAAGPVSDSLESAQVGAHARNREPTRQLCDDLGPGRLPGGEILAGGAAAGGRREKDERDDARRRSSHGPRMPERLGCQRCHEPGHRPTR
jgi:hypothetical protein